MSPKSSASRLSRTAAFMIILALISACSTRNETIPYSTQSPPSTPFVAEQPLVPEVAILTATPQSDTCASVEQLLPETAEARTIADTILNSMILTSGIQEPVQVTQIGFVDRLDGWVILQARFSNYLEPGIFLGQLNPEGGYTQHTIWGGPASSNKQISDYFQQQVPQAPATLLTCMKANATF